MRNRAFRNAVSVFLAFALVLTCNSAAFRPIGAHADDGADATQVSPAPAGDRGVVGEGAHGRPEGGSDGESGVRQPSSQQSGHSESEGGPGKRAGEPRDARDLSEDEGALSLTFEGTAFRDAGGAEATIAAVAGVADATAFDLGACSGFELRYAATLQPGDLAAGDALCVKVPPDAFSVDAGKLAQANEGSASLASFAVADAGVTATLREQAAEAAEPVRLAVRVPVEVRADALGEEPTLVQLPLQAGRTAAVLLPARAEPVAGREPGAAPMPFSLPRAGAGVASVTLEKEWRDNNAADRPVQRLVDEGALEVWFAIDGGDATKLTGETMSQLGLTAVPGITVESAGTSRTVYTCTGLPAAVEAQGVAKSVSYEIREDANRALELGYLQEFEGSTLCNVKTGSFTANVIVHDGGQGVDPGNIFKLYSDAGTPVNNKSEWSFDPRTGRGTWSVSMLPLYNLDGTPVTYHAKAPDPPANPQGDYYYPEYDNREVPNHGTNVTECHDGGTINLTLAGATTFTGTKAWLDDGAPAADRPDATFYLWRYTGKGGNGFAQASQVRDDGNNFVAVALRGADKDPDAFTFTVGAGGTYDQALPKYDAEGYPYVYLAREALSGPRAHDYEQVFGAVSEREGAFAIADTGPGGAKEWTRGEGDRSLYDGGTLSNRLAGGTIVSQPKTWKASAYQNQLEDVTVTLTLQSRPKGEGGAWNDTSITEELAGFKAETMTKMAETAAPRYDGLGRELEYRWTETSVKQGSGDEELLKTDEHGNLVFELVCTRAATAANPNAPERFTSQVEDVDENDPSRGTWIVNRVEGTVDYTIDKVWRAVDEKGQPLYPDNDKRAYGKTPPAPGASVTVGIFQDGKAMPDRRYTMDGTVDDANCEVEPYRVHVDDLPKYDEEGRLHTYVAEEVSGYGSWHSSYAHDAGMRVTNVKNDPTGPGAAIRVGKEWIDDNDVDHRYPVTVEVRRKGTAEVVGTAVLSEKNNWWDWVGVPDGTGYADYDLVETRLASPSGGEYAPSDTDHPGLTTVTTDKHIYKVTYGANPQMNMLTVTNKRIGVIDLTVTKRWIDQGNEGNRPGAALKLVCREYPDAVKDDAVVLKDGDRLPILDAADKPTTSVQSVSTDAGSNVRAYAFHNLPKYDQDGKVIHYAVEEVADDPGKFAALDYRAFITQTGYVVGDTHTDDQQAIDVDNKRVGTKDVSFHKEWIDAYAYQNGKRPDIYLTLWRKDGSGTMENMGYEEHRWSPRVGASGLPLDAATQWTAEFEGLAKYDGRGAEIVYYAQESANVDPSTFDYVPATYKNDKDAPVAVGDAGEWVLEPPDGAATVLKEGGTFVNAIQSNVEIEGKKLWENIPAGFPLTQLPKVNMRLNQRLGGVLEKEGIASTSVLTQVGDSNEFTFKIDHAGENDGSGSADKLPQYNEKGELFAYELVEEFDGTPPAGMTWTGASGLYATSTALFTLSNVFNTGEGNVGALEVAKTWDRSGDTRPWPVATFKLHRLYAKSGQQNLVDEVVGAKKLVSTSDSGSVKFDNLLVHAPDGQKYSYYVEEEGIDGFTATVTAAAKANPVELGVGNVAVAKVTNAYDEQGEVSLVGTKHWDDYGDAFGLRPADLTIALERWADAQSGEANPVPVEPVDLTGKVTWKKSGAAWTYSIAHLEKHAPNGTPWMYRVTETVPDDYEADGPVSVQASAANADPSGSVQLGELKNRLGARASVEKKWEDGGDVYKLRPTSVEVKLQVSDDGGATWTDAGVKFAGIAKMPAFEVALDAHNGWKHLFSNLPPASKVGGGRTAFAYRVVETKIGDDVRLLVSDAGVYSFSDGKAHTYTPSGVVTGDATTITNTMTEAGKTTLTVSKTWDDDGNLHGTRPVKTDDPSRWELAVKIQRSSHGDAAWQDVLQSDGRTALVERISGPLAGTEATSATFANLPKYDKDGNEYRYRAVEQRPAAYREPVHDDATVGTTSIANRLDTVAVSGTKTWRDAGTQGKRPDGVELALSYRSARIAQTRVPGDPVPVWSKGSDSWTYEYAGMPKFDRWGNEFAYTVEEVVPAGYWAKREGLNVVNTATELALEKRSQDGAPLTGAVFQVTGALANGAGAIEPGATIPLLNTDADRTQSAGLVRGRLVVGETYTVHEETPPPGHTVVPDFQVKLNADGSVSPVGALPDGVTVDGHAVTVKDAQNSLSIAKKNQFGEFVPGARLQLAGEFAKAKSPIAWTTDGAEKTVAGELVAGNEYTLSEAATPEGYLAAPDQVLRMTNEGELQVRNGEAEPYAWTKVDRNAFTFANELALTHVKLIKQNERGDAFEGARFSLHKEGEAGPRLSGIAPTIAADGRASWSTESVSDLNPDTNRPYSEGLTNGLYYFVETATADDYYLDQTKHRFAAANETAGKPIEVAVVNVKLDASMSLEKVDATSGEPVKGTAFRLTCPDGSTKRLLTDDRGIVSVSGLAKGSYAIEETASNANYRNDGFKAVFEVTDACKSQTLAIGARAVGGETPFSLQVVSGENLLLEHALANERVPGTVSVEKLGQGSAALGGVTFEVRKRSDDSPVRAGTTAGGGKLAFDDLPWGEYYLVETAVPDGYALDSTKRAFSIGYGRLAKNFTVAGDGAIQNKRNAFTLSKFEGDGTTGLAGSAFEITGVFAGKARPETRMLLSGAQSVTEEGTLVGGQSYTVKEATPPDGYRNVPDFQMVMGEDGRLALVGEPAGVRLGENNAVEVADSRNAASFLKVDAGDAGATVFGAEFKLEGEFVGGTLSRTWTSGRGAETLEGELVAGNEYALTETAPASGYVVSSIKESYPDAVGSSSMTIKIDEAGQLWYRNGLAADAWAAIADNQVVVRDAKTRLRLDKVDAGNNPVNDDGLELSVCEKGAAGEALVVWKRDASGAVSIDAPALTVEGDVVRGLPAGDYVLEETKTPAAYVPADPVEFSLRADGSVAGAGGDGVTVVMTNRLAKASVKLTKTIENNNPGTVRGIGFSLYRQRGAEPVEGDELVRAGLVTGPDGTLTVDNLGVGSYYFKETSATPDTVLDSGTPWTFAVTNADDGQVVQVSAENAAFAASLSLTKLDATSEEALSGASFELRYTPEGGGPTQTVAVPAKAAGAGLYQVDNLKKGSYTLVEARAPNGYRKPFKAEFSLTDADNGRMIDVKEGERGLVLKEGAWTERGVANARVLGSMTLTKRGSAGEALEGAEFTIERQDRSGTWTAVDVRQTDAAGVLSVADMAWGVCRVTETKATDGYRPGERPPTFTFEIGPDAGTEKRLVWDHGVISNEKTDVAIQKVDNAEPAPQPVSGARLKLTGRFADGTTERTWTSGADAPWRLEGLLIVGETYTLTEVERLPGYLALPGAVAFELTSAGAIKLLDNPAYVDGSKAAELSPDGATLSVRNVRVLGVATLAKSDGDTSQPLSGAVFSLFDGQGALIKDGLTTGTSYRAADWSAAPADEGELVVRGLDLGAYYFQETSAPGYQVPGTKHEFAITPENGVRDPSVDLGTVTNRKTRLTFAKLGLHVESCSDPRLGAEEPDATRPLAGAEFTAFADEACTEVATTVAGRQAVAVSGADGRVTFENLAVGTYWVRETRAPTDLHVKDETVYRAVFDEAGALERFSKAGETADVTTIVNDVRRADIVIKKVSELDEGKTLPGSTYGLYKHAASTGAPDAEPLASRAGSSAGAEPLAQGLQLIAKATTDQDGMLAFEGVLMNREYVVRELVAPDGSLVSEKPISLVFALDADGRVRIARFDDGSGTAKVDAAGNVVWREPQVVVSFSKTDLEGNLLAGAKLQVVDEHGAVVGEPWTSSADGPHAITGVLKAGSTYRLVEVRAPEGYLKAEDIGFTVENPVLGPDERFVQQVTMVNRPAFGRAAGSEQTFERPILQSTGGTLLPTGDASLPFATACAAVAAVGIGVAAGVRRRKR